MARTMHTRGFTLLEMMVSLAILASAYVALIEAQASAIRSSTYGKQLTIATNLAQLKIEEVEEKLTREGFPDMDDSDDGNFEEQGFPSFRWKTEVNKVELPVAQILEQLLSNMGGGEDEEGEGGGLGGLLGGLGQATGGALGDLQGQLGAGGGGALSGMLNPDMLRGSVEMLGTMLEQALREVRVSVAWSEEPDDQVVLTTHLVMVPQAPGSAAGALQPGGMDAGGIDGRGGGVTGPGKAGLPERGGTPGGRNPLQK